MYPINIKERITVGCLCFFFSFSLAANLRHFLDPVRAAPPSEAARSQIR